MGKSRLRLSTRYGDGLDDGKVDESLAELVLERLEHEKIFAMTRFWWMKHTFCILLGSRHSK